MSQSKPKDPKLVTRLVCTIPPHNKYYEFHISLQTIWAKYGKIDSPGKWRYINKYYNNGQIEFLKNAKKKKGYIEVQPEAENPKVDIPPDLAKIVQDMSEKFGAAFKKSRQASKQTVITKPKKISRIDILDLD